MIEEQLKTLVALDKVFNQLQEKYLSKLNSFIGKTLTFKEGKYHNNDKQFVIKDFSMLAYNVEPLPDFDEKILQLMVTFNGPGDKWEPVRFSELLDKIESIE